MHPYSVQDHLAQPAQFFAEDFAFVVCQQGSEATIKQHLLKPASPFRLAFSRPGLVTFKVQSGLTQTSSDVRQNAEGVTIQHPLIRQSGWVLGQVRGKQAEEMAGNALAIAGDNWDGLHVFARDPAVPGDRGFEPGPSPLTAEISDCFQKCWSSKYSAHQIAINQTLPSGKRILDVVLVEPNHWLIGYHEVLKDNIATAWPGGVYSVELPETAISRAYLKVAEAVAWSQLPIRSGDSIVEVGSAPGGAAQRLLDMGLVVTGIDPAEMDPGLLEHPRFTHWRAKSMAIKRKKYSQFRWLTADANVAPNYTLDSVEDIVTYPTSRFEGLILTLKLADYQLLENLEQYLNRIRSWGFASVWARQLAHNRREICVVAHKQSTTRCDSESL